MTGWSQKENNMSEDTTNIEITADADQEQNTDIATLQAQMADLTQKLQKAEKDLGNARKAEKYYKTKSAEPVSDDRYATLEQRLTEMQRETNAAKLEAKLAKTGVDESTINLLRDLAGDRIINTPVDDLVSEFTTKYAQLFAPKVEKQTKQTPKPVVDLPAHNTGSNGKDVALDMATIVARAMRKI